MFCALILGMQVGGPARVSPLPQTSHSIEQVALTLLASGSSCHAVGPSLESLVRPESFSEATLDSSLICPGGKDLVGTFGKNSVNATELGDFS